MLEVMFKADLELKNGNDVVAEITVEFDYDDRSKYNIDFIFDLVNERQIPFSELEERSQDYLIDKAYHAVLHYIEDEGDDYADSDESLFEDEKSYDN